MAKAHVGYIESPCLKNPKKEKRKYISNGDFYLLVVEYMGVSLLHFLDEQAIKSLLFF